MNQLEEAAVRYADRGWGVFPLYGITDGRCECGTNCGSPGKHPRVSRGLHDATVDEDLIRSWWTRWPNANVGVVTGEASGIYVIDIDNKRSVDLGNGILISEGENSLNQKQLDIGKLPETLTSQTGSGGIHIIYAYPTNLPSTQEKDIFGNRAGILPSVDTRGDGGYIVAPPSLHPSGNRYRWLDPGHQVAKLPQTWIRWFSETSHQPSKHSLDLEISPGFTVDEGHGRHDWLFRMGSKLRGQHGLPEMALYGALAAYNATVCKPPLPQSDVEHIVQSCIEYDPVIALDRLGTSQIPELLEAEDLAIKLIDFINEEPEAFIPLVSHLLNSGEAMVIGGPPNVGKTWAVMDMMLGISSGTEFAHHFHCSPGPVLFIDEEGSKRGDWERFSLLLAGREEKSAADFPIYSKIDSGIRMDEPRGIAALARLIERYRPKAVFLDSLVRVHGGNESDNRAMAEFFRATKRLMVTYETAFVFTHHIRKPSRDAVDDPIWMLRGASDIQGFPDSILVCLPTEDHSELQVIHTKMRNGKKLPSFTLGLQIMPDRGTAKIAYRDEATSGEIEREAIREVLLLNTGLKTAQTLADVTGIPIGRVKSRLAEMELAGAVRSQREAGTPYYQLAL